MQASKRRTISGLVRAVRRRARRLGPRPPDRRDLIVGPVDLRGRGLEFGPLDRPLVTRSDGQVFYVDHLSTENLRAKYETHAHVDTAAICLVDFVLDPGRSLSEVVGSGYDYVIASHVLEHVPDLVGWLDEMSRVLAPTGILALAVPDKRTTFDVVRPLTLPSDLVAAALTKNAVPSVSKVLEHHLLALRNGPAITWSRPVDRSRLVHVHDMRFALVEGQRAADGDYVDIHCWVFTPASFMANVRFLRAAGLTRFRPLAPPVVLQGEFVVHLQVDEEVHPDDVLDDDWDLPFSSAPAGRRRFLARVRSR